MFGQYLMVMEKLCGNDHQLLPVPFEGTLVFKSKVYFCYFIVNLSFYLFRLLSIRYWMLSFEGFSFVLFYLLDNLTFLVFA